MLKKERLLNIMDMVNTKGIITVNEIIESLKISDMTARRDLDELENSGKLVRIHGGAQSIAYPRKGEKSNAEKLSVQIKEKKRLQKLLADWSKMARLSLSAQVQHLNFSLSN